MPRAGIAKIELFDITGRRVKELWSGAVAHTKEITWQAEEFASGLYFMRAWDPLGNRPETGHVLFELSGVRIPR